MSEMGQQRRAVVVRDYARQYPDPIAVVAGTPVRVEREDAEYPGWWWCTAPDGRSGWVPAELIRRQGDGAEVVEDYSASELSVSAGQPVSVERVRHAWARVRDAQDREGWVPLDCLRLEE